MNENISQIKDALSQLKEALSMDASDIVKDGTIQRFEFTYELAWRLLKRASLEQGIEVNSPRQAFRQAGDLGLIENVDKWLSYLTARNLTTHVYDRAIADEVYGQINDFYEECVNMVNKVSDSEL